MTRWRGIRSLASFAKTKTKYGNKRTEFDGHVFASQKEANRYAELKLLLRAGKIRDMRLQPKYKIVVGDVQVCTYIADFAYFDTQKNKDVVEDAKGMRTPVYRLKKKLMWAVFGIEIMET